MNAFIFFTSLVFIFSCACACACARAPWRRALPRRAAAAGAGLLALSAMALSAMAQSPDTLEPENALETVSVVGTRTERALGEVEATISIIEQEDIERRLVRDIQDLVRYEPGVSVGGAGSRFGLDGFTIRGVGGNRVLTLVDGIRMPEEFSFGPFLSARRDFVDVDQIARLEIARGPVSTLYGSDALGGVVAIVTRAPNEYVSADDPGHLGLKLGYSSEDNSTIGTLNGAYGTEDLAALVTYTYRRGDETETAGRIGGAGPGRSEADPQDIATATLGLKLAWSPAPGHNLIAAFEDFDNRVDTTLLSNTGVSFARGVRTNALSSTAKDERDRRRYSLSYRYEGEGTIDQALATLYGQESATTQRTFEERAVRGARTSRFRDALFEQRIAGLFAQASSNLAIGPSAHTLTYGVDLYRTDNATRRGGGAADAATGRPIRERLPLPTRDFPRTEVENRALFVQDEIVLLGDRLRVTPGLRYDDYAATTAPDALYENGNPGVAPPADFADAELTLKLGALYRFTEQVSAWARYSEGFRAPPYDDVNVGFTNTVSRYKAIAAPGLKSETSRGYEFGLRVNSAAGRLQVAVFDTLYDNFIQPLAVAPQFLNNRGRDPADGFLTFQSVNLDEVEIRGLELRGALGLGSLSPALGDFQLEGALAYARGKEQDGTPVDTVDPMNAVLGLRWKPLGLPLESELIWTWSEAKDPDDIAPPPPRVDPRRPSDSYHLLDWLVHYEINASFSLDVGVFNLLDEKYIRWANTLAIGAADARDRFTQPGRNVSITLRMAL